MQHLKPNTTLQGGKYRIERVLGQCRSRQPSLRMESRSQTRRRSRLREDGVM